MTGFTLQLLKALTERTGGTPVPKSILDLAEAGDTDPLIEWLKDNGGVPDKEQLGKLKETLPTGVFNSIEQWVDKVTG